MVVMMVAVPRYLWRQNIGINAVSGSSGGRIVGAAAVWLGD